MSGAFTCNAAVTHMLIFFKIRIMSDIRTVCMNNEREKGLGFVRLSWMKLG